MTETNTLTRLHSLLHKTTEGAWNNNTFCSEVWADAFGISLEDNNQSSYIKEISTKLINLDDELCKGLREIENLESDNTAKTAQDLEPHLNSIRQGISPALLNLVWNQVSKKYFAPEHLIAIKFSGYSLDNDECELEDAEIEGLKKTCEELKTALKNSKELPPHIKDALLKRVNLITQAIETIRVFGVQNLNEATNELVGMLILNPNVKDALKDGNNTEVSDVKNKICTLITNAVTVINKGCGTAKNIKFIGEVTQDILEKLYS